MVRKYGKSKKGTDSRYWTSWTLLVTVVEQKFWVMSREMRKMVKEDLILKGVGGGERELFDF